ncbi:hypothetical protein RHMOL_Rhmol08G0102200 [Rhododendron molle]|uniref:Uncharacterized protein n=1 Tax=Rhododendron molle TaxID=49168 RepID=A0ACC0MLQ5_RHOML|nr:hypothetical protein RHMOL_Rhmol08G0102200 [Rhododendron molle]
MRGPTSPSWKGLAELVEDSRFRVNHIATMCIVDLIETRTHGCWQRRRFKLKNVENDDKEQSFCDRLTVSDTIRSLSIILLLNPISDVKAWLYTDLMIVDVRDTIMQISLSVVALDLSNTKL